jgi:hypothetical protein
MTHRRDCGRVLESERSAPHAVPGTKAFLVLGMHRSGTSAFTRVLNLRRAAISRQLLAPNSSNPLGHWEPAELLSIHDALFRALGSSWTDFRGGDPAALTWNTYGRFKQRLIEFLEREFSTTRLFVIKDPRMCRFVPLWLDATRSFGAEPSHPSPQPHRSSCISPSSRRLTSLSQPSALAAEHSRPRAAHATC